MMTVPWWPTCALPWCRWMENSHPRASSLTERARHLHPHADMVGGASLTLYLRFDVR